MKKLNRAVIKEELVELTGSHKSALVLNQFLYWTERIGIKRYRKFEEEETERSINETDNLQAGWIYKNSKELAEELMIEVSAKTIRRYINQIIEQGYLIERENPTKKWDRTLQYRVLLLETRRDLNKLGYELQGYKFSDKYFGYRNRHYDDSSCNNDSSKVNNDGSNAQNDGAIPEITTENTTETTNSNNDESRNLKLFNKLKDHYCDMMSVNMVNTGHIDEIIKMKEKHNFDIDVVIKAMEETKLAKNPTMFYLRDKLQRWAKDGIKSLQDLEEGSEDIKIADI